METRQSRLIVIEGISQGESFSLNQPGAATPMHIVIGRDPGVDILVESPGVSRRHAQITLQGDQCILEDLGSSNGTFLNGERISQPRRLRNGDVIRLGQSVALQYQGEPQEAAATMMESSPPRVEQTMLESTPLRVKPPGLEAPPPPPEQTALDSTPAPVGATMIGEEPRPRVSKAATPPQLAVTIAGEAVHTFPLTQPRITIGRAEDNQIVIQSRIVSRYHAYLEKVQGGYRLVVLPDASNPVLFEGRPIEGQRELHHGDILRIGSLDPGLMVTMTYLDPAQASVSAPNAIRFGEKTLIQLGRDASNDVVLDSATVSRFHAQIERVGQRHRLRDLHSGNGTFVNDQRVEDAWLQPNDVVRIGPHRFVMGQDELGQQDDTHGLRVDAMNLNKWVRKDLNILKNISVVFQPREFIVVVGQSGGGKSTLVDAIAGYRPATQGTVLVNGTNVYKNFDAVHNDFGYVPQRDIIHHELTVYQALDYAARLRMPRDTTKAERHERIMQVLKDLDMEHRKDLTINRLSGGQIKRVSIGVELLTQPGLFFLDEPTSGLDPGTETAFMHLMRRLADQGRTIVMVTHATKNVMLADKVVFLARGGFMAWFGPPEEALKYFDQYRTERERRAKEMEFDQIYAILDDSSKGSAQDWANRFAQNEAYQKYIVQPLQASQAKTGQAVVQEAAPKAKPKSRASGLHQFIVLSSRNLRILTRDRTSLMLMLLAPPLIAALDFVIAPLMGRAPFDYFSGDAANGAITLFLLTIYSLLMGGFSQMREFVKETDVYKRERLVNLKIFPYVSSKVWVALLLSFYQGACFTIVHFLAFDMPGGVLEFGLFYVTLVLAALAGMMGGLLASAISPTASAAPLLMIMLIVPQIVLSGALAPVPENISAIASTRWTYESLMGITGIGADVDADLCWKLPDELRDAMSIDDKAAQGCNCMGVAVFNQDSCNFPGLGQYYKPEIDQAGPVEPAELADKPTEPEIPPAPEAPADQNDQVAMVQYMNSLEAYQKEVDEIQTSYKNAMKLYESQAEVYESQMADYQEAKLEYEGARAEAVNSAEGLIENVKKEIGWAFVNKNDPKVYWPWLISTWGAQSIIILVYFILILVIFKRKDG
ncbi:MAG: FHA domain-containing protein [Anaerolineales bacterium]|nr:FHA domain-containing protein [Anaerolineales bacterium]